MLQSLERHAVPPWCVELEVTEHVFMASSSRYVHRALAAMKEAGMTIALDNFGTGYSSLSHLRDFPVDVVKIDQTFIQRMLVDPEIGAIVSAVVGLANSLPIVAVAEGVETRQQADTLRLLGCTQAQGYSSARRSPPTASAAARPRAAWPRPTRGSPALVADD